MFSKTWSDLFHALILSCRPLRVDSWTTLVTNDMEFSYASFGLILKFVRECPTTKTPKQKFKNRLLMLSSQEIGSSLV